MATNQELWDAAWKELTLTTDSYPAWKKKGFPVTSHWSKAKVLGEQITDAVEPVPPEPVPTLTVSQSITAGQVITDPITWSADPSVDAKVEFFIDGALKGTESIRPYEFNGDGNKLDPATLSNGSHAFKVKATAPDGATAETTANATVQVTTTPPPLPVTGKEGRVLYAVDMGGGWADKYVSNTAYRTKLLDQWDRGLSWSAFNEESWHPRLWEYIDSYAIYKKSDGSPNTPDLNWVLKDANGRYVYIDYACSGGTCTQYAADVGHQGWRNNIVARAKNAIAQGFLGVMLDDVNLTFRFSTGSAKVVPIDPRTSAPMTPDNWNKYFCEMLEQVRAAIPTAEIIHNSIWFVGPNHDGSSAWEQRQFKAADGIMYERGFNDDGIGTGTGEWSADRYMKHMDNVHKAGAKVWLMSHGAETDQQGAKYNLGGALLVSEGGDYQFHHYGSNPDAFWPGHEIDLGAAKGPRYAGGTNIVKRDFDKGTVSVDFGARTASIPGVI